MLLSSNVEVDDIIAIVLLSVVGMVCLVIVFVVLRVCLDCVDSSSVADSRRHLAISGTSVCDVNVMTNKFLSFVM
jgi:hypothetical protein